MYKQNTSNPTAHVAINKSRLKSYGESIPKYYLTDGAEFQIELFNPTTQPILAKISINGVSITQGGLVLKPAERVFLERYIDIERKFKFETYTVEATNEEEKGIVDKAIAENGIIKVDFYRQDNQQFKWVNEGFFPDYSIGGIRTYRNPVLRFNDYQRHNVDTNNTLYNSTSTGTLLSNSSFTTTTSNSSDFDNNISFASLSTPIANASVTMDWMQQEMEFVEDELSFNKETGRIDMGSRSDQKLETVDMKFFSYTFHSVTCQLLPISEKVSDTNEILVASYCTNCGTKQKKGFKFCPSCGNKN